MIHYFKMHTTFLLTWLNHLIASQTFFFWLSKKDSVLIPSISTPRLTICENTEIEQLTPAISIMVFSFSQGNVNFKQGQIDEHAKICSAVESHIEEIIQMEIVHSVFQLYIWLWLQPYHSFFIAKEWTDTINKFDETKIKNKVNSKTCDLCEKQVIANKISGYVSKMSVIHILSWNIRLRKVIWGDRRGGKCLPWNRHLGL